MSSNLTPTPKVAAAVIGGIVASALLANITLITPNLFEGLGKWSGLVYGLTITLVMGAAGWLKSESGTPAAETPAVPAEQPPASPAATIDVAPATVFPAAAVAAVAAVAAEPIPFTPIAETPAVPAEPAPVA